MSPTPAFTGVGHQSSAPVEQAGCELPDRSGPLLHAGSPSLAVSKAERVAAARLPVTAAGALPLSLQLCANQVLMTEESGNDTAGF